MSKETQINVMIAGAEKAGTTSLIDYLGQHPEIAVPGKYADYSVDIESGAEFDAFFLTSLSTDQIRVRVLKEFGDLPNNVHSVVAKCVGMLYDRHAIDRFRSYNPKAKLIVVIRSPVDRASSSFHYQRYRGVETLKDFRAAVARELSGEELSIDLSYLRKSRYMEHIAYLDRVFGQDNVLIVLFEALRDDVENTFEQICRFIGANTGFVPIFERRNRAKVARSQYFAQYMSRNSFPKRIVRRIFAREIRQKIYFKLRSWNSTGLISDPVPKEIRTMLEDYYEPDVKQLSQRTGIDLHKRWFG